MAEREGRPDVRACPWEGSVARRHKRRRSSLATKTRGGRPVAAVQCRGHSPGRPLDNKTTPPTPAHTPQPSSNRAEQSRERGKRAGKKKKETLGLSRRRDRPAPEFDREARQVDSLANR
ncbi:hypothetical protein MTO96_023330 [Rhipicephalus appendiculatus]